MDPLLRRGWLVFLLVALWICLESVILGPFSYVPVGEFGEQILPLSMLVSSDAFGPGVHYWLPSLACGVDRLANTITHPHPLTLLTRALPGWAAFQAYMMLFYFVAGYFTYRICVDFLKLSRRPAVFAGTAMACYSGLTGGLGNVTLPLLLWCFEKLLDAGWTRGLLGAALLGFLYSLGASAVVSMPFTFTWGFVWFALVRGRMSGRLLALYAVLMAFSVPVHLQELWAMLLQAPLTQRSQWVPELACSAGGLLKALYQGLRLLAEFATPVTAVGLVGLAAARFKPGRFGGVWAIFLFTVLATGLGPWFKSCLGESAGVLKGVHFHRFFLIFPLAAALIGGVGMELLGPRKRVFPLAMAVLLLPLLYSKAKTVPDYFKYGGYTALFKSPVIEDIARRKDAAAPFRVATFTHRLLPGFAHAYGLETVDGYVNLYSRRYFTYWSKVIEPVIEREPYLKEYFGKWGSQVYLYLHSVYDWPDGVRFADHYRLPLLSLANARFIISRHPLEDPAFKLLTPQEPWYKMHPKKLIKMRVKEELSGKSYLFVYENTSVLPRAFLVPGVRSYPDSAGLWSAMAKASVKDFEREVLVEASEWPAGPWTKSYAKGRIVRGLHGADRVAVSVELDGPGVLVVSNNFNPYWRCRVDGKERPVFPAYGTFWGLVVGKGDREVVFSYEPPYRLF
ncbi:MAG: hypothetical protein HY924_17300 [Elusimicrobia bacterium]|nr:hypothetical protein [Elusimicrobiota bacterium]